MAPRRTSVLQIAHRASNKHTEPRPRRHTWHSHPTSAPTFSPAAQEYPNRSPTCTRQGRRPEAHSGISERHKMSRNNPVIRLDWIGAGSDLAPVQSRISSLEIQESRIQFCHVIRRHILTLPQALRPTGRAYYATPSLKG